MYGLCMYSKVVNLTLPNNLVQRIDEAAKANYESRSDYIRESVVLRLNRQRIVDQKSKEDKLQAIINKYIGDGKS